MYRVLIVVLLNVAVSLGCRPPPCHWSDPKPIENYFEQVARKVINADRKVETFCNRQGSSITEVHALTQYKLILPGASSVTYEIKVRDRVVLIVPDNCQNSVAEVKVLPPYVDGYSGYYYFYNNNLEIAFNYKYDPALGGGSCEEVNRSIVPLYQGTCKDCFIQ